MQNISKENLFQLIKEDEELTFTDNFNEAIYIINGKFVSGNFYGSIRTVDHKELLKDGYSWKNIVDFGTILSPETKTAIGDKDKELCLANGYEILPLYINNAIFGYDNS